MNRSVYIEKRILLILVFCMMVISVACSKEEQHLSLDTVKILQSGTYYYTGQFYNGSDLNGYTIEMAAQGDDFVIAFSDKKGTELGRSVGLKGKGYYVDTQAKKYSRDAYYDDVDFSYSDLKYLETGSGKIKMLAGINDKEMTYDKYESTYGNETGTIKFYFQKKKLYAIQEDFVDYEGTAVSEVVVIKKITSDIPEDWFGIPEGFKKTT